MATLAIGDIHGCRKSLEKLMIEVNPGPEDLLIFLGDYVNRGPDSRGVIEFLIKLGQCRRCVFLRGNHEVMTMDARADTDLARGWSMVGGSATMRSYDFWGDGNWWQFIDPAHWDFMEKTQRLYETDRHIFVHGCLEPDLDLPDQPDATIYWERFDQLRPHKSGKKVVCGHTPDLDGEIRDVGYGVCIDTACVMGGWLTCLNVESNHCWQTNEKGLVRSNPQR